jgi:hypothetical protein
MLGGMLGGIVGGIASKLGKGGPGLKRKTDDGTSIAKAHPGSKAGSMMSKRTGGLSKRATMLGRR